MVILQEPDDDDEAMPLVKRRATEDAKLIGLAAILPKSKHLGLAHESGVASDYYPTPNAYSQGMVANEFNAQDALAEVLMREKRKGGRSAPVNNILEVKQADLTSINVQEDQLRTTGIAFEPAYKPMPSKLHRRKHQIKSLYFDMKQKESSQKGVQRAT
ncbi:hypothetical protein L7F22_034242 [Adiantum nelumboides]|nr:hypothetical protein [Adiantum nelumboides]